MKRRTFLVTAATLGGGLGLGLVVSRVGSLWGERSLALKLSDFLAGGVDARLIGRAYLDQVPAERDEDRLVALVFPALAEATQPPDRDALVRQFLRQVREDFGQDRMVRIQEWMLSQTEARLCALTTLG